MWRALVFLLVWPGMASALSCLPPDVAGDYHRAAESRDVFIVVHGQLSFDPSGLPKTDFDNPLPERPVTDLPARLVGTALGDAGFDRPFAADVTLRAQCFASWCAQPQPGEVLAFLKREGRGYVVLTDPCGTMTHPDPSQEDLARVVACHRGGDCTAGISR